MNFSSENSTSSFFAFSKITHKATIPCAWLVNFFGCSSCCRCLADPLVTGSKILRGKHHQKRKKFHQKPLLGFLNFRWILLAYLAYWVIVCSKATSFCYCHVVLNSRQCAFPIQTNIAIVYKALTLPLDLK